MAVDKNKIIAEATKLVQKGAFDKAIQAYQKILAVDPKDVRSLLKIGELQQKKGDDHAAAQAFERVADTYAEQGFFLKAVAVYKQIAKLDPGDVRVNERLAGLYQQLGLMSDAMSQYQFMAAAYEKAGDGAKLTAVLERMVELDPENIASSIKLGELYARARQPGPALECFRRAATYLKRHNRADEYLKVAERLAALSPDDLSLTRELANIYLAKGDTKRALAKLQLCFKADPKDVETLHLLAQAFRDLGQTSKTLSVYKELAHVHEERGRVQEARATWRKVRELAPDDEDALAALGPGPGSAPGAPRSVAGPPGIPRAPPPGPPPGAARAPASGAPPPPQTAAAAIPKLLTETDVYVKYGLHDKALDHLKKVIALDPQCAEAHERAREVLVAAGRAAEAAGPAALAVRALIARGEIDRGRDAIARLRQIAPDWPELGELNVALGGTEEVELVEGEIWEEEVEVVPAEVMDEPVVDDDALALAAARADEEEIVVDEPGGPTVAEPVELVPEPLEAAGDALAEAAAAASARAEDVADEPLVTPPPRAAAPRPKPAPPPRRAPAPAPEPAEDAAVDLSDELEEADFFVQQGLLEDARDALQNLLAFYPDHPEVRRKLADVERRADGARPSAPSPEQTAAAPPGDGAADESFDIARELADLGGGAEATAPEEEFQYSVEDVFSQFKKGVEQTVRREDTATHYDLGIAYKEMGLLDDAIHEFETALAGNDAKRNIDCHSMIGLCRVAKGDTKGAIEAFRRALASDHLTKDAARAIHYDLGAAHEADGDREAALYYFQRVTKADPAFRDAARRAAALGGGPGRAPTGEAPARGHPVAAPGRAAGPARPGTAPGGAKKNIGYL